MLPSRQAAAADRWIDRLAIRCADPSQAVGQLSGGNQQKVAVARLLHHDVDVLVLDEPTRGIDVASKAQIYEVIDRLVSARPEGRATTVTVDVESSISGDGLQTVPTCVPRKAVLLVSSYLPELLGVCDRIAVMSRGRLGPARQVSEWTRALAADGSVRRPRGVVSASGCWTSSGVLVGLVVVALIFGALIGPQFFSAANLELMARQTVIVCVAALGMTMVIVSGGIDLSVGSIVALSTVVTALLLRERIGCRVGRGAGGVAAGALCGAVNGILITQLRVVPFIVTLGTMLLVRGAAKGLADERRVEAPITWLNDLLRTAQDGRGLLLPSGIWITAVLAVRRGAHAPLHAVRPSSVRDRIERADGAAVRRANQRVQDARSTRSPAMLAALAGVHGVLEAVGGRSDGRRWVSSSTSSPR